MEPRRVVQSQALAEAEEARRLLEARLADLQQLNRSLEQRVEECTQALQRAGNELVQAEKLAALGRLMAGVSHELGTPIRNGLLAATTLADRTREMVREMRYGLRRATLDAYVRDCAAQAALITRSLERATDLVASFRQVAGDRTSTQRRRFRLAELVDENVTMLRPMLKGRNLRIEEDVPASLQMDSYPGPLGQVLTNMVHNALTHAYDSRTAGRISISARAVGDEQIKLCVAHDGRGIAPEHHQSIFEPFFTAPPERGGSGLGLHIAHTLVDSVLGGRIEVDSAPGQGCRLTLLLPVSAPRSAAAPAQVMRGTT